MEENRVNKRLIIIMIVVVMIAAGLLLLPTAQGEPTHQDDATAQQLTIEAVVQQRFTQTAAVVITQAAPTPTVTTEPPSPPTQTAAFEATVNAAFAQAMTATAQAEVAAEVNARGLEVITPSNATRLEYLGTLDNDARDVTHLVFGLDGILAMGGTSGSVRLWDSTMGRMLQIFAGHSDRITAIAISPDGLSVASASRDSTVRVWDVVRGLQMFALEGDSVVYSVAFSPDSRLLATGAQNGDLQLWDATHGAAVGTLAAQVGAVRSLAFHPTQPWIAVGGDNNVVRVWDVTTSALVFELAYHPDVQAVAYSPDGRWLVAASKNALLYGWDALTGALVWGKAGSASIDSIAYSPDGRLIASISQKATTLALWDTTTGARLATHTISNQVVNIAFSSDGAEIVLAGGTIRLWGIPVPGAAATEPPPDTPEPGRPTLTPRPNATPRPDFFPTDVYADVQVVEQVFERGRMFWIRHNRQIWVMADNPAVPQGGDWFCFNDTFQEGEPETDPSLTPPGDLIQPKRGFGKLWRTQPGLRDALGWATTPEFDLISYYMYIAGGTAQDGQYVPGPGEHRLTTLYGDSLSFYERELRGDCLGGTWQITGE
jgi:hypothetical protein